MQTFTSPLGSESVPVEMVIFDCSMSLGNSAIWDRFKNDCILPASTDRSGAANEEAIANIQARLRQRWRGRYF